MLLPKYDPLTRKIFQKNSADLSGFCLPSFWNQSNCPNHRNIWTMEVRQQMTGLNKRQPELLMSSSRWEPWEWQTSVRNQYLQWRVKNTNEIWAFKSGEIKNVMICFTTLWSLAGAHLYLCNVCISILRQQIPLKYR